MRIFHNLKGLINSAEETHCKIYNSIVIVCCFIFSLGLALVIRPKFEYNINTDIVSWVSINQYPKNQEIFYYIAGLIFIPSITFILWIINILFSKLVFFITKIPFHDVFKKYSLAYLPFILVLKNIHTPSFSKTLLLPIIFVVAVKIVFFIYDLFQTRLKKLKETIFFDKSSEFHWSIFTLGISAGLFVVIGFSRDTKTLLSCLLILGISAVILWLIWIAYSKVLSIIIKYPYKDTLELGLYSFLPCVILLSVSLFFEYKRVILIITIISILAIKFVIIFKRKPFYNIKCIRDYVIIPAIIYVIFYSGGNINGWIDLFHEGERLAPLNELLRGAIPYRDIYLQHGLFYNAWRPLLAAKLFGPSLAADRALGHILDPLGFCTFYILTLQIFRSKLSSFLLIWILSSGVSEGFFFLSPEHRMVYTPGRLALAFLAIGLLVSYIKNENRKYLIALSGICSTSAIFYSLEIGLYTTASCLIFLLILSIKKRNFYPIITYVWGLLIAFLPLLIYFSVHRAIDDLFINSFVQARYQSIIWGLKFPSLFSELANLKSIEGLKAFLLSYNFKWYLPILVYLITAIYLGYQALTFRLWKEKFDIILLFIFISGVVFFRTMLGRSDSTHLYGLEYAWLLGMFLMESLFTKIWQDLKKDFSLSSSNNSYIFNYMPAILCRSVVILFILWYVTSVYNPINTTRLLAKNLTSYQKIERYVTPPLDRIGMISIPADQSTQIKAVVEYIQNNTDPDETIFDFSNQGAYYFFADRPSATRYHQICYASTEKMQKEVIDCLEKNKTKLVIFSNNTWMDSIDGVKNTDRHYLIYEYLKNNYVESAKVGTTIFMKRKE